MQVDAIHVFQSRIESRILGWNVKWNKRFLWAPNKEVAILVLIY